MKYSVHKHSIKSVALTKVKTKGYFWRHLHVHAKIGIYFRLNLRLGQGYDGNTFSVCRCVAVAVGLFTAI